MSIITRINKAEKRIVDLYNKLKNLPSGGVPSGGVQSVTGDSVDNTDPLNPIINAIPLNGTTDGNPVTGDIELVDFVKIKSENLAEQKESYLGTEDGNMVMCTIETITGFISAISPVGNGVEIGSTNPVSRGLSGQQDFTPYITDLDYTQKKYVDERGSVFNATTSVLSASDLNIAYPNAKDGFSVIAPNVIGGGKYYIKAGAGWVYQEILAVV